MSMEQTQPEDSTCALPPEAEERSRFRRALSRFRSMDPRPRQHILVLEVISGLGKWTGMPPWQE